LGQFSTITFIGILISSTVSTETSQRFEPRGNAETAGMRIPEATAESPFSVKDWLNH